MYWGMSVYESVDIMYRGKSVQLTSGIILKQKGGEWYSGSSRLEEP